MALEKTFINPPEIRAPFGEYHHGVVITQPTREKWLFTSGQLGIGKYDAIPESTEDQTRLCFNSLHSLLAAAGMDFSDVVKITAYITDRNDFPAYMAVRDEYTGDTSPTSTLLVVSGFTRPEFKVEVEIIAVRAADD
ncbi:MAG: 2-iminobutanoate/2-iminopropanoate deaminase [Candidatus Azotimanducaceae bacterium]|jgi:2-iminobutanoate/2-iminopropanoate deaminase